MQVSTSGERLARPFHRVPQSAHPCKALRMGALAINTAQKKR